MKLKNLSPANYLPRFFVKWLAIILYKSLRIDYKNDIILYNELNLWIGRNGKKWRTGNVRCMSCGHEWLAVHLLRSTHLECPYCRKLTEYIELNH